MSSTKKKKKRFKGLACFTKTKQSDDEEIAYELKMNCQSLEKDIECMIAEANQTSTLESQIAEQDALKNRLVFLTESFRKIEKNKLEAIDQLEKDLEEKRIQFEAEKAAIESQLIGDDDYEDLKRRLEQIDALQVAISKAVKADEAKEKADEKPLIDLS